jgi:hypothetical protein
MNLLGPVLAVGLSWSVIFLRGLVSLKCMSASNLLPTAIKFTAASDSVGCIRFPSSPKGYLSSTGLPGLAPEAALLPPVLLNAAWAATLVVGPQVMQSEALAAAFMAVHWLLLP